MRRATATGTETTRSVRIARPGTTTSAPFRMVLKRGTDVDLSVVGKGNVTIQGTNGTIVLNGQDRILTVGASIAFKLHPAPVTGP